MVLITGEQPELAGEEAVDWMDSVAYPVLDYIHYNLWRLTGACTIKSLLPRPAGVKDTLTSTVLYAAPTNPRGIAFGCALSVGGVFTLIVPWFGLFYGIRMIFEKEMDKRVVVWARYTWEDALTQATTLVSALMWFPILTLIPLRAAQNLPWRGIRSFIQEDLIADWKNKLSLALLTFPAELCHMETIEEYLYGRFLASPEEEEEEEDPLLYAQEDEYLEETDKRQRMTIQRKLIRTGFHIGLRGLLGLMLVPFDVIIAHVVSGDPKYSSVSNCVRALWQEGGLLAFYRGGLPLLLCHTWMTGTLLGVWMK